MLERENMKKKITIITSIVLGVLLLLALGLFLFFHFKGVDKITITFDSDGGSKVEKITVVKRTQVELPTPTKEGYTFQGWYIVKLNKNSTEYYSVGEQLTNYWTKMLQDDIAVKAKWLEIEGPSITITFDSQGGSNVEPIVYACGEDNSVIIDRLPEDPIKNDYKFVSWADQHGTVILKDAKLTCEGDLTLYANWTDMYTCEDGSKPDSNHKCKVYMTPDKRCPSSAAEINGVCIEKSIISAGNTNHDKIVRTCGKSTIIVDNNGHTEEVQGEVIEVPNSYYYCAYGPTNESQYECTSTGHKWLSLVNKCYHSTGGPGENITYTCSQGDLTYLTTNEVNSIKQNANLHGCFKFTNRESYCSDSSYTLEGEYCIKKVDAKKAE